MFLDESPFLVLIGKNDVGLMPNLFLRFFGLTYQYFLFGCGDYFSTVSNLIYLISVLLNDCFKAYLGVGLICLSLCVYGTYGESCLEVE